MTEAFSKKLNKAFEQAISDYAMLDDVHGILIGYSGGADSSALLHLLHEYCVPRGIYLHALHVNHGIRGEEAERDAHLCRSECERLGVDFTLECADIPRLAAESGRGLEETARTVRYAAFERLIEADPRLDCAATAHNADDNLETVLFHLTRGSGIDGLCGIPPTRKLGKTKIIRPLISVPKCDIVGYCEENGIEYIFDSTNDDTAYTRNYIRRELLPRMQTINPALHRAASRMTANLREDGEYLNGLAEQFVNEHIENGSIDTAVLCDAARPIASRAVVMMYAQAASGVMLEYVHIEAILALAKTARESSEVCLPNRVRAVIHGGRLSFTCAHKSDPIAFEYVLHEGINRFEVPDFAVLLAKDGDYDGDFEKDNEYLKNIYKLSIHAKVNSDKINHVLYVRSRKNGDAYVSGGMTRKLKKLFCDRGLSSADRQSLPIFCDGEGIVWIPSFPVADRVRNNIDADMNIIYYCN